MVINTFQGELLESTFKRKFDLTDRKILYLLAKNARFNNVTISRTLNISKDKVQYRIHRLIKEGVLFGFTAIYDYKSLGFFNVLVLLKFKNLLAAEDISRQFQNQAKITRLLHAGGSWDLLIIASVKHLLEMQSIMDTILSLVEIEEFELLVQLTEGFLGVNFLLDNEHQKQLRVSSTNPSSFSKSFKRPIISKELELNDKDRALFKILSRQARISLTELASAC